MFVCRINKNYPKLSPNTPSYLELCTCCHVCFLHLQVPDKKIVQRWHLKTWPDAHFSDVTLEFLEKDGDTILKFKQTGIPSSEFGRTQEFWKVNYWQRIKQTFGFGSILF